MSSALENITLMEIAYNFPLCTNFSRRGDIFSSVCDCAALLSAISVPPQRRHLKVEMGEAAVASLTVCRSRGLTWKTERRKNDISNERGRELSSR